jgi:hypothetical protein
MGDVMERAREAVAVATAMCVKVSDTSARTLQIREKTKVLRAQARATRDQRHLLRPVTTWRVEGVLEGVATMAKWDGDNLDCDWEVFRRAEVLVAMGETFRHPQFPSVRYEAALEGDTWAVLLTVLRALDRVTTLDVAL